MRISDWSSDVCSSDLVGGADEAGDPRRGLRRLGRDLPRMTAAPTPGAAPDAVEASTGAARWVLLFGVWLVYLCFGMTTVSLAPVIGPITRDLGLSHGAMGSVLGIWQLVYIVAAIPCGALLDRLGEIGRATWRERGCP